MSPRLGGSSLGSRAQAFRDSTYTLPEEGGIAVLIKSRLFPVIPCLPGRTRTLVAVSPGDFAGERRRVLRKCERGKFSRFFRLSYRQSRADPSLALFRPVLTVTTDTLWAYACLVYTDLRELVHFPQQTRPQNSSGTRRPPKHTHATTTREEPHKKSFSFANP